MVVTGETVTEVLATATKTIISTTLEDYITDDEHGKPVNRPKRKAQLKTQKQLDAEAVKAEKIDLGKLSQKEFASRLIDAKTVEFEPFQEGPRREPKPIYPTDIDLDSPLAIFSLFWTEEMWQILAKNTNGYALRQGAVERGRDHTGARQHHGNWTINQRAWWPTNADELNVFVGAIIYMGIHPEGETATYWHQDLRTGLNHSPSQWITQDRFTQLQRFLHCSPDAEDIKDPTGEELDHITTAEQR